MDLKIFNTFNNLCHILPLFLNNLSQIWIRSISVAKNINWNWNNHHFNIWWRKILHATIIFFCCCIAAIPKILILTIRHCWDFIILFWLFSAKLKAHIFLCNILRNDNASNECKWITIFVLALFYHNISINIHFMKFL